MLLITDMVSASADSLEPQQQTFQNTLWFRSRQTGNRVAVVNLMGGPTGGYGYETYRQYFVDLAASLSVRHVSLRMIRVPISAPPAIASP